MKILNSAKARDIKAEGSIALGKGSLDVSAKGAFAKAKTNLELNTETTIQVSWVGGGVISPPEEPWTVESLARAATRFPDHVAQSPQRIYAILTKYETLRSYQALKPPEVTPIEYENATGYSNELLDTYMGYKSIYGRLTFQIGEVQSGRLKFMKVEGEAERKKAQEEELLDVDHTRTLETLSDAEKKAKIGFFPSTLDGLDDARHAVRFQMNLIVNRIDEIAKNPATVLEQPREKFLPSFAFETLLPKLESAFRTSKRTAPLTGEAIGGQGEDDAPSSTASRLCIVKKQDKAPPAKGTSTSNTSGGAGDNPNSKEEKGKPEEAPVNARNVKVIELRPEETKAIDKYLASRDDGVEESLRLTPPLGNELQSKVPGTLFTALDFVQPAFLLKSLGTAERITSVIVTVGTEAVPKSPESILSLKLMTNRGKNLLAQDINVRRAGFSRRYIGKRAFANVRSVTWESPLERGYLNGFWGWSSEKGTSPGIFRLGLVWSNTNAVTQTALDEKKRAAHEADTAHDEKIEDAEILARNLALREAKVEELLSLLEQQKATNESEKATMTAEKSAAEATIIQTRSKIEELERSLVSLKNLDDAQAKEKADEAEAQAKKLSHEVARVEGLRSDLERELDEKTTALDQLTSDSEAQRRQLRSEIGRMGATVVEKQKAIDSAESSARAEREKLIGQTISLRLTPFQLRLKSGKVLDYHMFENRAAIHGRHDGWNQTFRVERVDDSGFRIYCVSDQGTNWFLQVTDEVYGRDDCRKVTLQHGSGTKFRFDVQDDGYMHIIDVERTGGTWQLEPFPDHGNGNDGTQVVSCSGAYSDNCKWIFD
ncbi:unnamed protein product [Tilletia controversa]|nr:unnamed protein product [Tilletia controversa]